MAETTFETRRDALETYFDKTAPGSQFSPNRRAHRTIKAQTEIGACARERKGKYYTKC